MPWPTTSSWARSTPSWSATPAPALAVGATYAHLCWERRGPNPAELLTVGLLGRLRQAGLGIILWHEERPDVIASLRGLPVDGVCGNRPELLRPLKSGA